MQQEKFSKKVLIKNIAVQVNQFETILLEFQSIVFLLPETTMPYISIFIEKFFVIHSCQ